jgi:YjbE family integral membrane protein
LSNTFEIQLVPLLQVIIIDVTLAGDNALVVGLAASPVAYKHLTQVILWGTAGAVLLRVFFAAVTVQLLATVGLTLAGGILLLWVCWKLARELWGRRNPQVSAGGDAGSQAQQTSMSFRGAVIQIIVADVSMSLDNVLAVAGAAKGSALTLVIGLGLSIVLMTIAATIIATLLARHTWVAWLGVVIISYVAVEMIWRGALEVGAAVE